MNKNKNIHGLNTMVTLIIVSVTIFCSCKEKEPVDKSLKITNKQELPTIISENLRVKYYSDGILSYYFNTPLLERYTLAEKPYMEFTKGVHVETYSDSSGVVVTSLDADYAKYYESDRLWEAKGNVVAQDSTGKKLYTQQLFWDEIKGKIYSNVDTKLVEGGDVRYGSSFDADDKMNEIVIKDSRGRMLVDTTVNKVDTLSVDSTTLDQDKIKID